MQACDNNKFQLLKNESIFSYFYVIQIKTDILLQFIRHRITNTRQLSFDRAAFKIAKLCLISTTYLKCVFPICAQFCVAAIEHKREHK